MPLLLSECTSLHFAWLASGTTCCIATWSFALLLTRSCWWAAMVCMINGMQVYSAGLDNNITVWDLRKGAESMTLKGHTDSVTGLALDPDGTHLLSNAADNSLRVWDLRPYAPANRCEKIFNGHQHNYERNLLRCSWSSDGSKVCSCFSATVMHTILRVSILCLSRNPTKCRII